jgi:glycosyltransferase involved in cell wall biosynthesis
MYFHPLRIFMYKVFALYSIARLISLFRQLRPAVVHTNNVLVLPGALASWILRIPHVWHIREVIEGHHLRPSLWRIWRWIILTFSDKVICISKAVSEQFGESEKVVIVHDGVDTDSFRPLRNRTAVARKAKPVTFGIVGRLEHRRKGQDLFIQAASIALKGRTDLDFVIVGHERPGMEKAEEKLHDLVASLSLQEKIRFLGFVPPGQMPSVINDLDVLVLCSKQPEGLAIVLLEAMASGKAVISFAEGGPLDVIEDGINGLLVPAGDVEKLAGAMIRLASDARLRSRLGIAGRKSVEERFRSELSAHRIEEVYRTVLREQSL